MTTRVETTPAARDLNELIEKSVVSEKKSSFGSDNNEWGNKLKYLLVEDTDSEGAPSHLVQLFSFYKRNELSHAETFFLLAYLIGLECGFVSDEEFDKLRSQLIVLNSSACFDAHNVSLVTKFGPATYEKDEHNSVFFMFLRQLVVSNKPDDFLDKFLKVFLTGSITNDLMLFTLSLYSEDNGFSISLPISRYILKLSAPGKPNFSSFQKLGELSRTLKDELFVPLRNFQMTQLNLIPYPSLLGLPENVYDNTLMYLNVKDRKNLGSLSKKLQYIASQFKLRKNLVHFS